MTDDAKFILGRYVRERVLPRGVAASDQTTNRVARELEEIESIAAMYGYEVSVQPRSVQ